jgi:hypothetical protein
MAKFVIVDSVPNKIEEDSLVVAMPNFLEEIRQNHGKRPRINATAINHLRAILFTIGQKYDQNFNSYTDINLSNFEGRPYNTDEQLSEIVLEIINKQRPSLVDNYVKTALSRRSRNTSTVYFVGPKEKANLFIEAGLDEAQNTPVKSTTKKNSKVEDNNEV